MKFTKQQLKNLKRGRDFLANNVTDEQFNMVTFMSTPEGRDVAIDAHRCSTVGCALGWITREKVLRRQIIKAKIRYYSDASYRLFGLTPDQDDKDKTNVWRFLFASDYSSEDNTREGAIGRIDVILKYPDLFAGEV